MKRNKRTYNSEDELSKIVSRLQSLEQEEDIQLKKVLSPQLWSNLKMIDGDLPDILAWTIHYRWKENETNFSCLSEILESKDPLNFYKGEPNDQKMYTYKLKRFLSETAMRTTSEKQRRGEYDFFKGILIDKDNNEHSFHRYELNAFRNYLIQNTNFEQPSTGEDSRNPVNPRDKGKNYYYGWLYEENQQRNFKINLQVRFIK